MAYSFRVLSKGLNTIRHIINSRTPIQNKWLTYTCIGYSSGYVRRYRPPFHTFSQQAVDNNLAGCLLATLSEPTGFLHEISHLPSILPHYAGSRHLLSSVSRPAAALLGQRVRPAGCVWLSRCTRTGVDSVNMTLDESFLFI